MKRQTKLFGLALGVFMMGGVFVSCNSGDDNSGAEGTNSEEATEATTGTNADAAGTAVAEITATYEDTAVTGKATFTTDSDGKVKLNLELNIPARANKEVAVHLHEHGDCGDHGNNSHGHWNPTNEEHGKWGGEQFHRGDIGNVVLDADGKGTLEMITDLWEVGGEDATKNIMNRAVIVHGGFDDYVSQPTGNAGNRLGCGVIQ